MRDAAAAAWPPKANALVDEAASVSGTKVNLFGPQPGCPSSDRLAEMEALEIIDAEAFQQRGVPSEPTHSATVFHVEILGQAHQGAHKDLVFRDSPTDP